MTEFYICLGCALSGECYAQTEKDKFCELCEPELATVTNVGYALRGLTKIDEELRNLKIAHADLLAGLEAEKTK